ncbi:hypothetical protein DSO57_1035060 [Entomophthora muscae]|uniref:Uncharacterized protein n=1 Tax=Entomophthora muscae TaxID=34485 RepID=A0ACC2S1T9_9FUNG|nr:hypothetical protein DSO57_1035060 [Entomophthora muscae]
MVNRPKRNKKPVVHYTNVPVQRFNQAPKQIPEFPVVTTHKHSPVLALEETDFTEMLGGKINAAFCSSSSTVLYKPSTFSSKSESQNSSMPTSNQLSTIAKKRSWNNKSKTTSTTPTNKNDEPAPNLTNLLRALNKSEVDTTPMAIQEDNQGSYLELSTMLCWEKFPILHFCGPVVMWSTLMLALESPYVISTKRLEVGNNVHWCIPWLKLVRYAQLCLQDFSFDGIYLTEDQISCALEFLELVFLAWTDPQSAVGPVPLWHGLNSHEYRLQRAMSTVLELLSYNWAGRRQSMVLVGNLVLSGSKVVYHQRLHHMPEYVEWLLGVMYSVGGKTPKEYAQQESLLWECILLGLAFPYSIGVNRVSFLPVNDSLFLSFAFRWLPSVWMTYAAIAKVLIQLRLGLEATVSQ